ncbi:hypothetical protein [Stigmatella aurantiaca]|uniref:Putative peroxidase n=1 Tax=Stigmatella aurantiaca (strain DW4/3-1) TaxID=378806 RepID=Q08S87_STIAD|nr:hypothetical protein [Stigmatella aurantiaca]ADO72245.1 uncharacterized protein STAUR_4465 [Stigmatella aurantiaca DW4/3-1]EAU63350.1 putative peroxidase [Stigmatella aurantiaca DW4/3-1]
MTNTHRRDFTSVRPSKNWKEVYLDGSPEKEKQQHEIWAQEHAAIQKMVGQQIGTIMRGQHASPLHSVRVVLEPYDGLPEFARQGFLKEKKILTGTARFSTGSSVPEKDDSHPGVRGLAVALRGPDGPRQDFLTVNMSWFFKNTSEVMTIVRAQAAASKAPSAQSKSTMLEVTAKALGAERAQFLLDRIGNQLAKPVYSLAAEDYFGTMPIRWGPYAVKPCFLSLNPAGQPSPTSPTYLRDGLKARLREQELAFELCLQFYEDDQRTPIEDLTNPWQVDAVPVARLTMPRQDLDAPAGTSREQAAEELSFSPWNTHGHEPVGEIGRARKSIYGLSAKTRGACMHMTPQVD